MRTRINHRWRNILKTLADRTWVSIEDVQLLIPNLKYARRVMRDLIRMGLVKTVQCSMPFLSKGPGLNFYAIKNSALRYIDTTAKEPKIPTSTHLYHFYITNYFLTGFTILSKKHDGFICFGIAERDLRSICQEFHGSDFSSERTAIPDFGVLAGSGNVMRLYLGEIDVETETISNDSLDSTTISNKFSSINRTCQLGLIRKLSDKFSYKIEGFSYLHVTSGNENRAHKVILTANNCNPPFPVFVACFDNFYPGQRIYDRILMRSWYSVNINKKVSILEDV